MIMSKAAHTLVACVIQEANTMLINALLPPGSKGGTCKRRDINTDSGIDKCAYICEVKIWATFYFHSVKECSQFWMTITGQTNNSFIKHVTSNDFVSLLVPHRINSRLA